MLQNAARLLPEVTFLDEIVDAVKKIALKFSCDAEVAALDHIAEVFDLLQQKNGNMDTNGLVVETGRTKKLKSHVGRSHSFLAALRDVIEELTKEPDAVPVLACQLRLWVRLFGCDVLSSGCWVLATAPFMWARAIPVAVCFVAFAALSVGRAGAFVAGSAVGGVAWLIKNSLGFEVAGFILDLICARAVQWFASPATTAFRAARVALRVSVSAYSDSEDAVSVESDSDDGPVILPEVGTSASHAYDDGPSPVDGSAEAPATGVGASSSGAGEAQRGRLFGRAFSSDEDGDGPATRGSGSSVATFPYSRASVFVGLPTEGIASRVNEVLDERLSASSQASVNAALGHWR
eukprot:6591569-Prymnesium_polylepis.1